MRDPSMGKGGGDGESVEKNIIELRTTTVIKSRKDILENYPPRTLLRKNFCISHLSSHCFPCSHIRFSSLRSLSFS